MCQWTGPKGATGTSTKAKDCLGEEEGEAAGPSLITVNFYSYIVLFMYQILS